MDGSLLWDYEGMTTFWGDVFRLAGHLGHEYVHSWNGKYRRPETIGADT
jgi:predicted metalloprotease with PDZ domain